ncbi:hypothetical protein EV700_2797 [Fluviicoccus keumensis]|uniref:NACHT domain-containing protein n=1 Tax=Fluviicoccus keumensis TaxID=1435465 RepID=A0A4Q7YNG9_9GAMM|nr:hypothetical protein [Fluviicoccus keumensis]RZU38219.1 hypothetical protein EV700_2797 [Fluviicoccus keumensis]
MLETMTLEAATKAALPVAKSIFYTLIKPHAEAKIASLLANKKAADNFESSSIKYLAKLAGQCSIINTIAFQNTPKKLEDLYIALTIINETTNERIIIDDSADIFATHTKIIINDNAGMGKSTLSKKIILNTIRTGKYIPVFIELRQLKDKPIEEQILSIFGIPPLTDSSFINQLPLAFVFDGMDEIANDLKRRVVAHIHNFINMLEQPRIIITSRRESYISEFHSFESFSINKLSQETAYALLFRYDPSGDIAKKLIEGIRKSPQYNITEFLSTPLYVSLLFCSYRHKTVIPQKRHLFYAQVYDALFESHDLSKEIGYIRDKHSKLDSAEFHTVLRRLGFWCMSNSKIEFTKDELEIVVSKLLKSISEIKTTSPEFVKDLTSTVPLFIKDGPVVRWSHKSLMEYFASMFICHDTKEKQQQTLLKIFNSDNTQSQDNILTLCADIDFPSFRASVGHQVISEFVNYYESAVNNRTIATAKETEETYQAICICFSGHAGFQILTREEDTVWENHDDIKLLKEKFKQHHVILEECLWIFEHQPIHAYISTSKNRKIMRILREKTPTLFGKTPNYPEMEGIIMKGLKEGVLQRVKWYSNCLDEYMIHDPTSLSTLNSIFSFIVGIHFSYKQALAELEAISKDKSNGVDDLLSSLT